MISIPSHISKLSPYKPGKSSDPSDFLRYKAILSSNENNYGPSPMAIDAMGKALASIHLYPDPQGEHLIEKLAAKHNRKEEELILSNGLDGLLYSMFMAFTVQGDEVITNEKSFVAFNKFAGMNNLKLIQVPNKDHQFSLDDFHEKITKNTKIIYLCNPNNPTGSHITKEALVNFLDKVSRDILVVVDEAYFDYAKEIHSDFPDSSALSYDNLLVLRTFSKLYGLAGVRIGYGIAPEPIIDALRQVKLVFNPNTLAQVAALAALDDTEHVQKTISNNTKWVYKLEEMFTEKGISFIKSYANFVCAVFEDESSAGVFFNYMDQNGILLRNLAGFGMPEGVRVSIGNDTEMQYFEEVFQRFVI